MIKMLKKGIIFFLLAIISSVKLQLITSRNFSTYVLSEQRFCSRPCRFGPNYMTPNVGCQCEEKPLPGGVELVEDNLVEFRKVVVEKFNEIKNTWAKGAKVSDGETKPAAASTVLNYDLGLEYGAGCAIKKLDIFMPGMAEYVCFRDKLSDGVVQFTSFLPFGNDIQKIREPQYVAKYIDEHTKFFLSNMTVATATDISVKMFPVYVFGRWLYQFNIKFGCARLLNSNQAVLICLICSQFGIYRRWMNGPNLIYDQGPPCSKCPYAYYYDLYTATKCNEKYTSLCGTIYDVPTNKWELGIDPDKERPL